MFYRDQTPRPADEVNLGVRMPATPTAWLSLALAAAGVALLVWRPDLLGDRPAIIERVAQAGLLVGMVGSALHGLGIRPGRRLSRLAADPRVAWPILLLGSGYLVWLPH